jgi:hypothetical protein
MLTIFTEWSDWISFTLLGLAPDSKLGGVVQFFIEDMTKIFFLLVRLKRTLIYVLVGLAVGITGGIFLVLIHAEKLFNPLHLRPISRQGRRLEKTPAGQLFRLATGTDSLNKSYWRS